MACSCICERELVETNNRNICTSIRANHGLPMLLMRNGQKPISLTYVGMYSTLIFDNSSLCYWFINTMEVARVLTPYVEMVFHKSMQKCVR
uniref:Uncharacterized protein n=1 Tax=Lactuca sativa TaxID=4236 RepID=A0A9R1WJ23_LACSA|nr:hypothetical protein LSAT_V11C100046150 [Lactuca sativa]